MTAGQVLSKVLDRARHELFEKYQPVLYPLWGTYDWLDRKTGAKIENEEIRDWARSSLTHYAHIIDGLQELIDKKYITKEEVTSMFTDEPEH